MSIKEVLVPDIGDFKNVEVIELNVAPGDQINIDDSLMTLETDKASMDIPSPFAGTVKEVKVKVGEKISQGDLILTMEVASHDALASKVVEPPVIEKPAVKLEPAPVLQVESVNFSSNEVYAGPAVRRFARALGVDLTKVKGTGRKNRIEQTDVEKFVKAIMQGGVTARGSAGLDLMPLPKIDFSKFGPVETVSLSRIQKISGKALHRNWVTIPHVTQLIEADITELEAFRNESKKEAEAKGLKLTPIVFIMKAVIRALHEFPRFNASLDESGENLILKKYFHIGVAVDTPSGLVVPVIRDAECKGLLELAKELSEISLKARDGKLKGEELQGGCFTISSLGGIGGTAFTPIINAPEVAILGVSKSFLKPVYRDGKLEARLMLPLSLSYDHRVIDGAEGARFIVYLSDCLSDPKKLTL